MDVISACLALAPVPYLSAAFTTFQFIWDSVQRVQASKEQLRCLAFSVAQLLHTLDGEIRFKRLHPSIVSSGITDLQSLLREIASFIGVQSSYSFIKLLFTKDDRIEAIEGYRQKIAALVVTFQASLRLILSS
jgi:hypothetical protein